MNFLKPSLLSSKLYLAFSDNLILISLPSFLNSIDIPLKSSQISWNICVIVSDISESKFSKSPSCSIADSISFFTSCLLQILKILNNGGKESGFNLNDSKLTVFGNKKDSLYSQ
jgi:hypothetical protein